MRATIVVLVTFVTAAGCSAVKPYQRELLAQPAMSLTPTPEHLVEQHMFESREGSFGGFGGAGGGCGCN